MVDKKEENQQSAQAAANAGGISPAQPENKPLAEKENEENQAPGGKNPKHFKSAGKRIHNELTYRGVDWLLNSTIGVAFTYWAARTHNGQKYFSKPVQGFFKSVLKPMLKTEESLDEGAKWGAMFASIMAGGTAIIPPMVIMENKKVKKKVIRWLDEKIYGEDEVENDPKFEELYRKIDAEPKKDFVAGMTARLIAIAPLITITSMPAINKSLIKYLYDPIGKLSKRGAKAIGIKPAKMLAEGEHVHLDGNPSSPRQFQSNWDFLHRTVGFDFGQTIFYSIMHEIAYKTVAAMRMKKKDPANVQATSPNPEKKPEEQKPALPAQEDSRAFTARIQPKDRIAKPDILYTDKIAAQPESAVQSL